ncbi:MAG: hypothetical protein HZB55_24305 [Deltaproteobacteria bacterium]|nr:hypothetical protein [Deltaproteobacteria bacterium]
MTQRRRNGDNERHLDLLALDAVRAGEAPAADRAHAEACPVCRRELELLQRVAAGVRSLERGAPEVPAAVDEAILGEFGRAAGERRVVRVPTWRWAAPALGFALAASLAWLLLVPRQQVERFAPVPRRAVEAPAVALARPNAEALRAGRPAAKQDRAAPAPSALGDVNGDGNVDILDAYCLAALLREHDPRAAGFDENTDGAVDGKDVEELAMLAVAVR